MPTAAIIGASRGIGREFVTQYLEAGWTVHATARRDDDVAALASAGAKGIKADTTDEASLARLADQLPEIDLLIVNAGVNTPRPEASSADIDPAEWERVMRVNALGPILAARTLRGKLHSGGTIVAISSYMGSIGGESGGGSYSYRMSKAALNMGLSRFAMESAGKFAVAVLHPGWVKTDMGGEAAPVEVVDSVAGMRQVIAGLTAGGRCAFADYQGRPLPW